MDIITISFTGTPKAFGDLYGNKMGTDQMFTEAVLAMLGTYCAETGNSVSFMDGNGEELFTIEKKQ